MEAWKSDKNIAFGIGTVNEVLSYWKNSESSTKQRDIEWNVEKVGKEWWEQEQMSCIMEQEVNCNIGNNMEQTWWNKEQ